LAEQTRTQRIHELLYSQADNRAYAVLDGASVPGLVNALREHQVEHYCLFHGDLEPDMQEVAPYVVALPSGGAFGRWVLQTGWGEHWGVLLTSQAQLRPLRGHLRNLTTVKGPDGRELYFRFYDPRVLQDYLPTCNGEELEAVFGPVTSFLVEAEDGSMVMRFRREGGGLRSERITLGDAEETKRETTC